MNKRMAEGFLLVVSALALIVQGGAADLRIESAGERVVDSGVSYDSLINMATDGAVVLKSSGAVVESDKLNFTAFDAPINSAQTTFSGGWWDFGVTSSTATDVNFFTAESTCGNRRTVLDNGAVVTNVGRAYIAGADGVGNSLVLQGGSTLQLNRLGFQKKKGTQNSTCVVREGAVLVCKGDLALSDGSHYYVTDVPSGSQLTVMGAGSKLTVGGNTTLGYLLDSVTGSTGGNTLTVIDGATAELGAVIVSDGYYHGQKNKLIFGKDSRVTMRSLKFDGCVGWANAAGNNALEILAGAVVTNQGALSFGYNAVDHANNTMLISNGLFSVKSLTDMIALRGPSSKMTLSGPDAKFIVRDGTTGFFGAAKGCLLIVENYADYTFPATCFSASEVSENERILVRDHATLRVYNNFKPTNPGWQGASYQGKNNTVSIEGDSSMLCNGELDWYGAANTLSMSNSQCRAASGSIYVGKPEDPDNSKDCNVVVSGSRPFLYTAYNLFLYNGASLTINLPEEGYEDGYAVPEQPLILAAYNRMIFNTGCQLKLSGAKEMLAWHDQHGKKAEYVLLQSATITLQDGNLDSLQDALPDGMTLFMRQNAKKGRQELVLKVKPVRGLVLMVR